MTQFFKKFPVINYANSVGVNLLARVNMSKLALANKQTYYDYVMTPGLRPDSLSYNYYDNPDFIWLIGLTNGIIDPYYDFPLSEEDLNKYISNKYGSYSKAQNTIVFFRNNWSGDDSNITVVAYNALGVGRQKYWAPQLGYSNQIIGYVRKQEDWTVTTNQVYQLTTTTAEELLTQDGYTLYTCDSSGNPVDPIVIPEGLVNVPFVNGELLQQNGVTVATVASTTSDGTIVAQHISGTLSVNPIYGLTSGAAATVTSITLISQSIPTDELVYWSPVTAYDYEHELNENKKQIKLLDNKYAGQATKELKNLLMQ